MDILTKLDNCDKLIARITEKLMDLSANEENINEKVYGLECKLLELAEKLDPTPEPIIEDEKEDDEITPEQLIEQSAQTYNA
jgi:galactose-1-phosphate uridylyltransferase